ncbi:uncharacterized protein LOC132296248 [Cornus florida]|uniref:uncharacterized protein LOC132296248 n=1 Tax=Cornus florida TaxID=4283 RepID=UPI0028A17B19|nr:uncharacterized protein LOC132296248 [Cornus florida]
MASFIYGVNDIVDRREFWEDINCHAEEFSSFPWIVLGDFNATRILNEKYGGSMWNTVIYDFRECLYEAGIYYLRYSGIMFTWNNKSHGAANIPKKLDRALCNDKWTLCFPNSECIFLSPRGGGGELVYINFN